MEQAPLVSVVLPVHNAQSYVAAAVKSVLLQDYRNLELIAIDDGSRDRTLAILAALQRQDARVRLVTRENRGIVPTLNEGLSHARGALIARMDADDIAYPGRIAEQVAAFLRNPELAICGSEYDLILSPTRGLRFSQDHIAEGEFAARSVFHSVLGHPTVMLNRAVIGADQLRYDEAYEFAEDFELFSRVGRTHPVQRLRDRLLAYRVHPGSVSSIKSRAMRSAALRVVAANLAFFGLRIEPSDVMGALSAAHRALEVRPLLGVLRDIHFHALALAPRVRAPFERSFAHFVHEVICEVGATSCSLARELCEKGNFWTMLRKRERYFLQLAHRLPGLGWRAYQAGSRGLDMTRSVRLDRLIPRYREITGNAAIAHM
jgi:glycosyltransferase involved in cell wall biosynthesis